MSSDIIFFFSGLIPNNNYRSETCILKEIIHIQYEGDTAVFLVSCSLFLAPCSLQIVPHRRDIGIVLEDFFEFEVFPLVFIGE